MNEGIRILIVEDSQLQAAYLQRILEQRDYHVSVAYNGKEALTAMKKYEPLIVISDIIMPEMDGYELCRRMRADGNLKHIPIILLTQLSSPEDVIRGLECGANNFVTKPYSEEVLLSCMQRVLANRELRKNTATEEDIEVFFADQKYSITSDRTQILDLLLSTYEVAVEKNSELEQANKELRKAFETIKGLETDYRMLLEKNADAIVVIDRDGVVRFVNPAAEAIFGRKAEEVLGELSSFPVVAGETTEVSVTRSNGETAVAEMRVVETNWEGENTYLASLRDITRRKRVERELRETNTFLRNILESSASISIMSTDLKGNILYWNVGAENIFGYKADEVVGSCKIDILYPDEEETRKKIKEIRSILFGHGKEVNCELKEITKDGRKLWINLTLTPRLDENGQMIGVLGIGEDITERKQVEEALRESEARYRLLAENLTDVIWTMDMNFQFTYVSPSIMRMRGYSSEETMAQQLEEVLTPDSFRAAIEALAEELTIEKTEQTDLFRSQTMELGITCKDGSTAWPEVKMSFLRDRDSRPIGILVIARDITERKQAEKLLRESKEREAQAFAQGRLEIVDTILHNIGNAINSVTIGIGTIQETLMNNRLIRHLLSLANAVEKHQDNFGDYIENDPQGQKVAPFIVALADDFAKHDEGLAKTVSRVRGRAEHIADIIRTEKTLSRRSTYRKDVNLREVIDNAIIVLQDSIEKRGIRVSIDLNNTPKEINIQESQFHQMLVNFIKNSIEAIDDLETSKGLSEEPFIRIKCYTQTNSLILEVTDNGIGMEKGKLDVIFGSGYTTKDSGSGLGLHSIANFVKGCDGQILALSNGIGKGATMRVELPLPSATSQSIISEGKELS